MNVKRLVAIKPQAWPMVIAVRHIVKGRSDVPVDGAVTQTASGQCEFTAGFRDAGIPQRQQIPIGTFDNSTRIMIMAGINRTVRTGGNLHISQRAAKIREVRIRTIGEVCWAAINTKETIIVADVEQFPGHIACDSRSKSEIAVPLKNNIGEIVGVLDIDSKELNSFDKVDADCLLKIVALIYNID